MEMIGPIEIRQTGFTPTVAKRALPPILKAAYQAIGVLWHREMRPRHFEPSAHVRYGYQRRTNKYLLRKHRQKGHQKPMVYSGVMQQQTRIRNVIATGKGVKVRMHANALNFSGRGNAPDMRKELLAFTDEERQELTEVFTEAMTDGMDSHNESVTTRV